MVLDAVWTYHKDKVAHHWMADLCGEPERYAPAGQTEGEGVGSKHFGSVAENITTELVEEDDSGKGTLHGWRIVWR